MEGEGEGKGRGREGGWRMEGKRRWKGMLESSSLERMDGPRA